VLWKQEDSTPPASQLARWCELERKKERASKYTSSHFSRGFATQVEQIPDADLLEPTDAVVQITHACMCGTDL
jgi:hypothetical protein